MDAEILQAIRIIDAKIASLQEARDRLATAFGIGDGPPKVAQLPPVTPPRATPNVPGNHTNTGSQPSGRKVQLAEFLSLHGPMSRTAIVEQAGIPEGTVSYCLNDKRCFEQRDNGDWDITDFSRRGLERHTHGESSMEN